MPKCNNCGNHFPNRVVIDGKLRTINKRKYCLTCSPFGKHNTRKIGSAKEGDSVTCIVCKQPYVYKRSKGHTKKICNSCMANRKRFERKKKMIGHKGGCCMVCGYSKCDQALVFHHIGEKEFTVSGAHGRAWKYVKKELSKCVLLCANCHAEVHAGVTLLP